MSEFEIVIPIPNNEYGDAIIVNKYNDTYSLVAGFISKKEGATPVMKWCFPQGPDRAPKDKAVPWKITIGNKDDAVEVVTAIAKAFGVEVAPF